MLCRLIKTRERKAAWIVVATLSIAVGCTNDSFNSNDGKCITRYKFEMTSAFQVCNLRINKQPYGERPVQENTPLVFTLDVFDQEQVLSDVESPSDLDQLLANVETKFGLVSRRLEKTGKTNGNMATYKASFTGLPAGKYRSEIVIQRRDFPDKPGVTLHTLRTYPLVIGEAVK